MLAKSLRLFNTLKHLRVKQLWYFLLRRALPPARVSFAGCPGRSASFQLANALPVTGLWQGGGEDDSAGRGVFTFLNISKPLGRDNLDWRPADVPRLWRYNLHYFDYLRQQDRSEAEKRQLMEQWVACNPQGSQPGWEPFTASLRIVNWIVFLQQHAAAQTPALLQSLYTQALWLEKNDERHILANHYFENLKALTFAGAFFEGDDAARWLRKGVAGLVGQLAEQTLPDGGHYERTPQYHGLMLENYLDLYNLASHNPGQFSPDFAELLKRHSQAALRFYQAILFPDQQLPLFNDTAFGISPSLAALDGYYQRLTAGPGCLAEQPDELFALKASGLFGCRGKADMFIIDAGAIGPRYQPGHTHCDMLSYELMLAGQRVVVDTGVCEYEPGPLRQHVRSTRAHNTVSVDGAEQSEVWGEFRVARRAKVLSAHIERQGSTVVFEGAYQGFHRVGRRVSHHRRASLALGPAGDIQSLAVVDVVDGIGGQHHLESYIHLHPDIRVDDQGGGVIHLHGKQGLRWQLVLAPGLTYVMKNSIYCPEFGLSVDSLCVVIHKYTMLPCEFSYSIS